MIRFGIRAARPLRGRANSGLWNPIETRKALLIYVANHRITTLARERAGVERSQNHGHFRERVREMRRKPQQSVRGATRDAAYSKFGRHLREPMWLGDSERENPGATAGMLCTDVIQAARLEAELQLVEVARDVIEDG